MDFCSTCRAGHCNIPGANLLCRYLYISDDTSKKARLITAKSATSSEMIVDDDAAHAATTSLSLKPTAFQPSELRHRSYNSVFVYDTRGERETREEAWLPLVETLSKFKKLDDIIVTVSSGLPPGLLSAIEQKHPHCRLHLHNFRFKSLNDGVTDPDERALPTSKNLHSLDIMYLYRDSNGVDDHNGAAALRTVSLAKGLKHVRMLGCRPGSSPGLYAARNRPLEEWGGFVPPIKEDDEELQNASRQKTTLESLEFSGYDKKINIAKIRKWEDAVDFSSLKILNCATGDEAFLQHVAARNTLPKLEQLTISLQPGKRENDSLSSWESAIEHFFACLPPLTVLKLSGQLHENLMGVVFERHGPTLQTLRLDPSHDHYDAAGPLLRFTPAMIELLASCAPRLKQLSLTMKRTMGDRNEVRCYEALGALSSLEALTLRLDCTNANAWDLSPEEDWDDFDKATQTHSGSMPKNYNGHLKMAMVNSALDEDLVRQIWLVINKRRQNGTLELLSLDTFGGSSFDSSHPGDLMEIVGHVSRQYFVTKDSGLADGIMIEEEMREDREEKDATMRKREMQWLERDGHRR